MALSASKRALRVGSFALLLAAGFIGVVAAQNAPNIVWQAAQAGDAVAISTDGQLLLSSTKLWNAANGTLIRTFHLPYFGSGGNTAALSPDGPYSAIGIQACH